MVELLPGYPDHVVAYKATGIVNENEYSAVVMERVDEVACRYPKINFIVVLRTDFENYSFSAFVDYLIISFEHFGKWNRMAIVTNENWVRFAYRLINFFVPGKIKCFTIIQLKKAKQWVSTDLSKDKSIGRMAEAGIAGTSAMTAFSCAISTRNRNFKEPELLSSVVRSALPVGGQMSRVMGWTAHYLAGLMWTRYFTWLMSKRCYTGSLLQRLAIGISGGLIGLLAWKTVFKLHRPLAASSTKGFYRHLVLAHILFSLIAMRRLHGTPEVSATTETPEYQKSQRER